jgi:hypothetical protein
MLMKKLFFLALLASAGTSYAQGIKAGTVSLGGNVGYYQSSNTQNSAFNSVVYPGQINYSSSSKSVNRQFTLAPSVGYFVADNFAIGATLEYTSQKQTASSSSTGGVVGVGSITLDVDPSTTLRLGLYAQYYKMLGEQFGLVGTLNGGYQTSTSYSLNSLGVAELNGKGYYTGVTPGIVFFPIPKLGISASVGGLSFNHYSYDYPKVAGNTLPSSYENETNTFGANFGLSQLLFGGTYYFGR